MFGSHLAHIWHPTMEKSQSSLVQHINTDNATCERHTILFRIKCKLAF